MNYSLYTACLLLFICCACSQKKEPAVYNDLKVIGYKGKIKKLELQEVTEFQPGKDGKGITANDEPSSTSIYYYNEQGNLTRSITMYDSTRTELVYQYSGTTKTGWEEIAANGTKRTVAKITASADTITETSTDMAINASSLTKYILDGGKRVKTMETKFFDSTGKTTYHTITAFVYDNNGDLIKRSIEEKLGDYIQDHTYNILERDKEGNPVKTQFSINAKTHCIINAKIEYWP